MSTMEAMKEFKQCLTYVDNYIYEIIESYNLPEGAKTCPLSREEESDIECELRNLMRKYDNVIQFYISDPMNHNAQLADAKVGAMLHAFCKKYGFKIKSGFFSKRN